ncbi:MAG: ATP-binding cassette domain-containing protein, partial [Pseudomonadota bacterium]
LPQQAEVDRSFPVSVIETVVLGLWRKTRLFRPVTPALWREAQQALATVGLDRFERRSIGSLSAGQFQRVMFARLLLQDSPVILLDEPFAAIDTKTADDLLGLVLKWHRDGRTVIAVLHDLDQVLTHFPRTLLIAREPIAWGESQEVLSAVHLSQARSLAHAWGDGVGQGQRGVAWTSTTR